MKLLINCSDVQSFHNFYFLDPFKCIHTLCERSFIIFNSSPFCDLHNVRSVQKNSSFAWCLYAKQIFRFLFKKIKKIFFFFVFNFRLFCFLFLILIFFLFYLDRNSNVHVLVDVSSVFDCANSSTSSAITNKHTNNANKTTKKRRGKNKNKIGNTVERTLQTKTNANGKQSKNNCNDKSNGTPSSPPKKTEPTALNDEQTVAKSAVWTQVVQCVQDTQNVVMMAMLLVFTYLFCYDRAMRT